MESNELDILKRALAREKAARKQAEKILEDKSAELYELTNQLYQTNNLLQSSIYEKDTQLKGIFENIVDAYVVINPYGDIIKMNDPAQTMLGFNFEEEKIKLFQLVHPIDKLKVELAFKKLLQDHIVTDFQVKIITRKNIHKTVQINASVVVDKNNKPIAAQGIVRDITKEKIAENLLKNSENRMSILIKNLDSGVMLVDENETIILTNNKFCELLTIDALPENLVGHNCTHSKEIHKHLFKNPDQFANRIDEVVSLKQAVYGDVMEMINGRVLERNYVPIFEKETYKGHLWSYKDITLEQKYHKNMHAQKQKYSNIIANMNLGLLEVDLEDHILMANQSFIEMSGYSEKELIHQKAKELFVDQDSSYKIDEENSSRLIGKSNSYEISVHKKNGDQRYWLISGAPNYDINGKVIGSIGIHLDITDFKNLEKQKAVLLDKLEKSNKELEEYAHIVSHDLKSPLRSINALVSWLKEDNQGKLDEVSLQNISLIEMTLEKMEKLISDILNYSSITADSTEENEIDLNVVLDELKHVLYFPSHISMKVLNPMPTIKGDFTRFLQLFQNIVSNAIRYIDKEIGIIEVDVVEFSTYYQFSIKDNGIGIEKKNFDKIFKIFQSLNENKESTGIGLSIVKKIISIYKGEIWLESTFGKGTTFYFTLLK